MKHQAQSAPANTVVELHGVSQRYGERKIFERVDLSVTRGEVLAIVGGSGSGKSTLLRQMLMLAAPSAGSVSLFGERVNRLSEAERAPYRRRMGTLFQYSALFGALTVRQNVAVPLEEHTKIAHPLIAEIAAVKIALVGLAPEVADLYPSQLSGGMRKRAGLARALALDPELLFLDEPHSGLDPHSADTLDELIAQMRSTLGLTIVMVTHDMDACWNIADRVAILGKGKLLGVDTMQSLAKSSDPDIKEFFAGARMRAAQPGRTPNTAGETADG